jgi:hypothetical protein
MYIYKLPNANGSVITVTSTATLLTALINTAASASQVFDPNLNAVDLYLENGDVRMLTDGNTPTASKGLLLKSGGFYSFRGVDLKNIRLIRVSSDVSVSVQIGQGESGELTTVGAGMPVNSNGSVSVDLLSALAGVSAGVENDTILTGPYRRPDAFQDITYDSTNVGANSATSIKTATASKKHYITSLTISTTVATTVTIQDASANVLEKVVFPAAGVFVNSYPDSPLQGATNSALQVISSAGSGNLTVKGRGYTI